MLAVDEALSLAVATLKDRLRVDLRRYIGAVQVLDEFEFRSLGFRIGLSAEGYIIPGVARTESDKIAP